MNEFSQADHKNIKFSEKFKGFLYKLIHYFGIIFSILVAIYALYNLMPEFIKFCFEYIIKIMKSDYPNL
ncbi:MAG: hypothetical protein EBT63_00425 [Proteobacteria bacterium]|jgi:hypothetical protein|nr:hypothetical protein [Pseudomonadota bacterium]NCA28051.1 hypothetical protein [Pseudomonadota bacterium]